MNTLCSDSMFHHSNRSFRTAKEKIENEEGDLEAEKEKTSEVFEAEEKALLNKKRPGVYNCDSHQRSLFPALVWKCGSSSKRKKRHRTPRFRWLTTMAMKTLRVSTRDHECEDEHSGSATRRCSVLQQRNGKLLKAGAVEAGEEERVVHKRVGCKTNEGREFSDGLLRWFLPHAEGVYAA